MGEWVSGNDCVEKCGYWACCMPAGRPTIDLAGWLAGATGLKAIDDNDNGSKGGGRTREEEEEEEEEDQGEWEERGMNRGGKQREEGREGERRSKE